MGRPRSFDLESALDSALLLFWEKGYEGTTLADLTLAMGINRPSFYAAFESKEALFKRAVDRYEAGPGASIVKAFEADTARQVVERLLFAYADAPGDPARPRGCLLVQGALACGAEGASMQSELASRRAAGELALRARLTRARDEGDLPKTEKPADLARYIWTVCQGMAVQAAGGSSRAELRRVAMEALRNWPSS